MASKENLAADQVWVINILDAATAAIDQGALVRIVSDEANAKRRQRSNWHSDSMRPCLGQLGVVIEGVGPHVHLQVSDHMGNQKADQDKP